MHEIRFAAIRIRVDVVEALKNGGIAAVAARAVLREVIKIRSVVGVTVNTEERCRCKLWLAGGVNG
jgi:hypothetical protein